MEEDKKKHGFSGAHLRRFLQEKFNLDEDKASQEEVMENVRKGVEFKGTNLWVLIFATFVASLGLNVNSAAVIIGAMLISPLMGPIMGIGLSLGINDFELMKRSVKNFGFMVLMGILTSTLYFFISPLSNAQSELLARTVPTTYDVLIAFFGGLAGIVAQSRKDRTSTVIPGVAIATALMPPLCTAGFGLATGQLRYFIGAFYLFLINTVFIAFATFFVVRFLKYRKKVFLDKRRETKVRRYMSIILFATFVPSVIVGYRLIRRTIFDSNADRFVSQVVKFEKSQVIDYRKEYHRKGSRLELILVGDPVSQDAIDNIRAQLPNYNLERTILTVRQPTASDNISFSTLQENMDQVLSEKNRRIAELESVVDRYTSDTIPCMAISKELSALSGNVANVAISRSIVYSPKGAVQDTVLLCMVRLADGHRKLNDKDRTVIENWLRARTDTRNIKLYVE